MDPNPLAGPRILKPDWEAYDLLDCGGHRKLERFGKHLLIRGEPKAWWKGQPHLKEWKQAVAEIGDGGDSWSLKGSPPRSWTVDYGPVRLEARLTDRSKHVGIFPEQEPHWRWLRERIEGHPGAEVLNLFGYTGAATLVAAAAGARVTHVDASKPALAWARHNQELSGLGEAPIRWILDDAFKFVAREVRRKRVYDAILLDPPSFGRGPKGEIWKVEQQIAELLLHLRRLLRPSGGLLILTLYNLEASSLMLAGLVGETFPAGSLECGELVLPCLNSRQLLPLSLFARWQG